MLAFIVILFAVEGVIYYKSEFADRIQSEWIDNIFEKCKVDQIDPVFGISDHLRLNDMFYRDVLIDMSDVLSIFGAYLGICLDAIYLGGTP